jgi:GNAT superfamily N-acetyltransferase
LDTEIFLAQSDAEVISTFPAFHELRPHLDAEKFLAQVRRQEAQSFQILALRSNQEVVSAAGFRVCEFLAWGKVIYIDDLTTVSQARGRGYAGKLLDWLIEHAKASGCTGIHLDTGYGRHAAHRVYLQKGLQLNCHHMALYL